jgi:hypothetical protein
MNLRVILIMWIMAIASLLISQQLHNLRFSAWSRRSTANRNHMLVLFQKLILLSTIISPFINEQMIKLRRNL